MRNGLENSDAQSQTADPSIFAKLFAVSKGPLILVTIVATGLIALSRVAVDVVIVNIGCKPIVPVANIPFTIPGLSLPNTVIDDGESGVASLPPLTFTLDGRSGTSLTIQSLSLSYTFELPERGIDLMFNDTPLLGKRTVIDLSEQDTHRLEITCEPSPIR